MKLDRDQIVTVSRLSDEWLDLPEDQRLRWRVEAIERYPLLMRAIEAMVSDAALSHVEPELNLTSSDSDNDGPEFSGGQRVGPYRLNYEIGRGGMGTVWLAEQSDENVNRTVALKLPLHHVSQRGLRTRFARERNILAALDHPGIAKMFDAGVSESGQPYMAMQYVRGIPITSHCDGKKMGVCDRVRLCAELLAAVQHAHSNLVVHRDIKPGNILVDDSGRTMLLDFGIAKLLDADTSVTDSAGMSPMTEFAGSALTLDYASPEQVAGHAVSTRSDIYSLGVVLYELLTGRRPYRLRRATKAALEEAVLEQHIQPPSSQIDGAGAEKRGATPRALAKQLRGDLDAIVLKAMAKSPLDRYATAEAFAEDLQRWLRKEPVSAQPDQWTYRVRRLLARRWKLMAVAASIALVLVATSTVAVMQAQEARRASLAAQDETRKAQAVTTFLKDLFNSNTLNQVDPAAARKRTAEQLLDDGAQRMSVSLKDAPELQIALLHDMTVLYAGMRLPNRVVEIAQQAADTARQAYGERDPRTLAEIANVAVWAFSGENNDIGRHALEQVQPELAVLISSGNLAHRQVAARLLDALLADQVFGNVKESLNSARLAEDVYKTLPAAEVDMGRHHILGVVLLRNFALDDAYRHFMLAEQMQEQAKDSQRDSHPAWFAQYFYLTGKYKDADAKLRLAHAMERHNDAGGTRVNDWILNAYAQFLLGTSRASQALELTETGGPQASESIRAQLQSSAFTLNARARALIRLGPVERGLEVLNRADENLLRTYGAPHVGRTTPYARIEGLLELGKLHAAEEQLGVAAEILKQIRGEESTAGRHYWYQRVQLLMAQEKVADARNTLESGRAFLSPPGVGLAEMAMTTWLDAKLMHAEGNDVGALKLLNFEIEQVAKSEDRMFLREWEAKLEESRGVCLQAMGDLIGAQRSFDAALEIYQGIFDPKTSIPVGRVALRLAALHKVAGRPGPAKAFQTQSDAIRRAHPMFSQWVM